MRTLYHSIQFHAADKQQSTEHDKTGFSVDTEIQVNLTTGVFKAIAKGL